MTQFRLSSSFRLVLLCAPIALTACSSISMPTGYTYEHEYYRAPKGPEAPPPAKILESGQDAMAAGSMSGQNGGNNPNGMNGDHDAGYTASAHMDADGTWNHAGDDLVAMILRDLGKPMERVYVPGGDNFVPAMKAALTRHDIPVAANPGDGPFVIEHDISGENVTIHFFSNHEKILSESGALPTQDMTPPQPAPTLEPVSSTPTPLTPDQQ